MHALLYSSHLRRGLTADDLQSIIASGHSYTSARGLTGLFLYGESLRSLRFAEWLEGPKAILEAALERIALDSRHEDADILWVGKTRTLARHEALTRDGRLFYSWSALETHVSMLPSTLEEFLHLSSQRPRAVEARQLSTA